MLTRLVIENFKCFKTKQELDFTQFNVITGPSGSGKSTIIHAVKLLLRTYLLDPIVREQDYAVLNVDEMLPNRDKSRRIKIGLTGKLLLPYVNIPLNFDIELSLSVSDGMLSTGVEIESTKIPRGEMLQAMFAYVLKEHTQGKYSIKLEAHYLTHSIFNVKVVYPRITIMDKEMFVILYQDIFPKLLEDNVVILDNVRNIVEYSFRPSFTTKYSRVVQKLLVDPQVKYKVSKDFSKILEREFIIDVKKDSTKDEYIPEDLLSEVPLSAHGTAIVNMLYILTALESIPQQGTLIIDDFDMYLDEELLKKFTMFLIERCLEKNVQVILTTRYLALTDIIVKTFREHYNNVELKVYKLCKHGDECKIIEQM